MNARSSPRLADIVNALGPAYRNAPASRASLDVLEHWLSVRGLMLPREYHELLHFSDGLQIDNDLVYSAEECRWQTEELAEESGDVRYLAIGREGNVACWVFSLESAQYLISSFSNPDEVLETFADLASLLSVRLRSSGFIA